MSTQRNGTSNGAYATPTSKRFSDIPSAIDVPVHGEAEDEAVEIDLEALFDDPTEVCTLLENERAARTYWMTVALAYAKQKNIDHAIEMLVRGGNSMRDNTPREKLSLIGCLCWMYLWKVREAPRLPPDGVPASEAKTKEHYLQLATSTLNDASRINPAFPPLFLARGGKNMLAVMGKARALFSLGKFPESLACYQEVLGKMPDLVDPDPRIGIGACFWQLGFKDDARSAWERCLEINPDHKVGNILLGLYYLDASGHVPTNSPDFIRLYKKAMTEYTQKSFKLDKNMPLTCATFANYFLSRKQLGTVDTLAHKAIQYTDVNAIASDGWYLLARKEHHEGDPSKASDYYRRADDARGGAARGYLPAKFGAAQLSVMRGDLAEAKLTLEKMVQQSKHHEALVLLGTLYAEEVFANQDLDAKEDKSAETKKAIGLLESVRGAWRDSKKNLNPDAALEMDLVSAADRPPPDTDEAETKKALRRFLPPQLLNNIGCFYSQSERHEQASELFEAALDACMKLGEKDQDADVDALVTTISFNLGRSYESRGMLDDAVKVYEELLKRHDDYTDARVRLAYIKLRKFPHKEGPEAVSKLYKENARDLEVRALYGWYLGKVPSRKRSGNINEDDEFRHYKHTLRDHDKHDRYALVGAGNLHLLTAREMRRESDSDKAKRSAMYTKAVEFFEKALSLDPLNAYAAQGIAIALVEDRKDYKTALGIFVKIRDTVKDAHVFVNLGHIYAELRQYSKALENYETALSKEGKSNDPVILACLGRTWLNKGRSEKNLDAYNQALSYAKKASHTRTGRAHIHGRAYIHLYQEKLQAEREAIAARDREIAERRAEEEKARAEAEMTTDSETGERGKAKRGARKKKGGDDSEDEDESEEERPKPKKRRLAKKEAEKPGKFKSAEIIVDSDEDEDEEQRDEGDEEDPLERAERALARGGRAASPDERDNGDDEGDDRMDVDAGRGGDNDDEEDDDAEVTRRQQSKRARRGRVVESDEEDEEDGDEGAAAGHASGDDDVAAAKADTSMADADDDDEA
ncbi:hypothetical protein VdG1_07108 [Verticillium dahliae VDG1]|nr:hypothetical protein VdG1_07108 [Verticillium dahliae VDG1]